MAAGLFLTALGIWGAAIVGTIVAVAAGVWYLWAAPVVAPQEPAVWVAPIEEVEDEVPAAPEEVEEVVEDEVPEAPKAEAP